MWSQGTLWHADWPIGHCRAVALKPSSGYCQIPQALLRALVSICVSQQTVLPLNLQA
jgi:hypothetical protein